MTSSTHTRQPVPERRQGHQDMTLRNVTAAARRKRAADTAYRNAVVQAARAGHTARAIGAAAGVTRQAVQKMVRRATRTPEGGDQ